MALQEYVQGGRHYITKFELSEIFFYFFGYSIKLNGVRWH